MRLIQSISSDAALIVGCILSFKADSGRNAQGRLLLLMCHLFTLLGK